MLEQIITITAVFVGWGLNELSRYFRSSKEHREAISQALSILLEVRFQIIYLDRMIPVLHKGGIAKEEIPKVKEIIKNSGLSENNLLDNYNKAIETVSKNAPLIAYEYRSRASFPKFMEYVRKIALDSGADVETMDFVENQINSLILPRMNELILVLAKLHSRKMHKDVLQVLNHELKIEEIGEDFFNRINNTNKSIQQTV